MTKKNKIDFSDIPELTDKELKEFRRVTPQEHAGFHEAYISTFGKQSPRFRWPPAKMKKSKVSEPGKPPLTETELQVLKLETLASCDMCRRAYVETHGKEPPLPSRMASGDKGKMKNSRARATRKIDGKP